MCTGSLQSGNAIDDIDRQVEPVDLIADCELKRRIDVAPFPCRPSRGCEHDLSCDT